MKKHTPLWCEGCRFVCFETGLGKPMLTLNNPNRLKNTTNAYSIHLELRMALPCQISTGKWKYVNPGLDFLGIPDQRTAYVKRQVRPGWTYVRRSSVTPDLITYFRTRLAPGPRLNIKTAVPRYGILMLKIRRSQDHPIFNMGIPIPVRRHSYIKTPLLCQ